MSLSSPVLRRFVLHALVGASGVAEPDRRQFASAFELRRSQLRTRFNDVFGTATTTCLLSRAHDLSGAEFPWVMATDGQPGAAATFPGVTCPVHAKLVATGFAGVLADGIELVSELIGDDLTIPMVRHAWGTG